MKGFVFTNRIGLDRMARVASDATVSAKRYVQDGTDAIGCQIAKAEAVLANLRKNAERVTSQINQLEAEISFTKSEQIREEKSSQLDSLHEAKQALERDIEAVTQNISCTNALLCEWVRTGDVCLSNIRKLFNEADVTSLRIIETVSERP